MPQYTQETLRKIYDKTDGRCHLCDKKLSFINYGKQSGRAPWEVDHSQPQANGGTHHLNNLYPACVSCNRSKQDGNTRSVRRSNGLNAAPLSREKKVHKQRQRQNKILAGAALGAAIGGPVGAVIGGGLGALLGSDWKS